MNILYNNKKNKNEEISVSANGISNSIFGIYNHISTSFVMWIWAVYDP